MYRLTRAVMMMVLLCCLCVVARAQVANFTIDDSAGCSPLVVHFTNTTSCASCTYTWSLGNSTTSTLTDVSGSYVTPGTYTVTLTANNGTTTTVRTSVVTVFPAPIVSFFADDTSVCPGVPMTFTSISTAGVPGPMTYSWNFGDGDSSTAATPSHPFVLPGFYNITLSVTNAEGCVNAMTRNGYVRIFNKPTPNFTGSPTNSCTAPVTVNFTNTSSGTGLVYNWSFGDGGSSASVNPARNYTASGTYTVKLRATSSDGCVDSLVRPAYIHVGDLAASFTAPATGCVGTGVTFANTSTPHAWSSWNFGDASGSTLESPVHVFTAVGTYTVSMVISDGPCFSTATRTITIYPLPTGTFTITPARPCPAPVTLTYNSTVTPGASVSWSHSAGGTETGITATHTYAISGTDSIYMTVTTPQGCSVTVVQADTIYNLLADVQRSCDTLAVTFTGLPTTTVPSGPPYPYPYAPYTYSWSLGDGTTSTAESPTHIYSATGTYVATVTMTTANGCSIMRTIAVTPILSTPIFTLTPTHVCYGETVTVTPDTINGPVDKYEWYWGDGGTTLEPGICTHIYNRPGEFVITVTPTYEGCKGRRLVTTDTVTVDSPKATIQFAYSCINKDRVAFFDTVSLGADSHLWVFGDGDTSTTKNPVHTYPGTGQYHAYLYTYNSASGCRDTADQTVRVIQLHPDFQAIDSEVCRDDTVWFSSTVADSPSITASLYEWYVGGELVSGAVHSYYIDTFNTRGIFAIGLVTTDAHNCRDTIIKPNYLHVAKPQAWFRANVTGCAPLIANFVDSTNDIPGTFFTKYAWDFGDTYSDTSLIPTISHTYTAGGTYSVKEIVTDNIGCKDTVTRASYIRVNKPFAFFYADVTHPCPGTNVTFTNMTAGISSATWLFGDGGSSAAISPVHVYSTAGSYSVRLAVIDTFGCTDTTVYNAYITVTKPEASFSMNDSFNVCPPMTVNFTNTSHGATNYYWSFGDGNASVVPSPSNIYVASGMYSPRLIVTDAFGCKDTAIKSATIFGFAGAFTYTPTSGCSPLSVHFSGALTGGNLASTIWDFADGITVAGASDTITHVYTSPGSYMPKLILSDSTGCTNFSVGLDTIKVSKVNAAFKAVPDKMCIGGAISFVDSTTSRFSPVYTWSWSMDGSTSTLTSPSHTFTNSGTIPITLTATNSWGCVGTVTKNVTINPLPAVIAGPDTIACSGASTQLTASGAATYTWTGGPLSCTTCTITNATPAITTTYSVTGIDTNGCVNKDTARITVLSAVASGGGAICPGDTLVLSNMGSGTWTSADATIATIGSANGVVTAVAPGTVLMSYTLPAGCYALIVVTVNTVPGPIVVPPGICAGAVDTLADIVTGGTWTMTTGTVASVDAATGIVTALTAGTVTVTYTISSGCSTSAVVTINPVPGTITGSAPMCVGGNVTLSNSLSGGSWHSADTATAIVSSSGVVTGVMAGNTTITYDRAGCATTAIVTVEVTPDAGTISGPAVLCVGATITLTDTATGAWSSSNTTIASIGSSSGLVSGLRVGVDTIVYTTPPNSAGCFDTAMYIIAVDSPSFNILDSINHVSCYGGHNGRISVVVDQSKPYSYAWSNGVDTTIIDSLIVGAYSLTVTSTMDKCYKIASYIVTQPDSLFATIQTSPDSCFAGSGRTSISVYGGVSPYSYEWSNSAVTADVTGLMPGSYSVTVTDTNSCIIYLSAIVAEDSCFEVLIYDVITPNGDGVNDTWVISGLERYPQNTVQIFDKWGDVVYERDNYGNEWHGQGRGEALLPDGTYFYLVRLNAPNRTGGQNVFKGTVLIKR